MVVMNREEMELKRRRKRGKENLKRRKRRRLINKVYKIKRL